ncbi:hypothetical protein GIB67_038411 [Kingdonia uniflora]|uniref:long-chain-alcohol oxidase n=1 Tax=Kingdonia uniflora TaxID=39325 RepID=A0A7J7NPL2_9MAGN|nr:hypothetical protein GIB67_038411 [Kingdonia uniflora]
MENYGGKDHTTVELGELDLQAKHGTIQQPYRNTLSSHQMHTLTAFCDTLLPSIDLSDGITTIDDSLFTFYKTSASMTGTQNLVGGFLSERLRHPSVGLLMLGLWALSTWYGTFIMCGKLSLTSEFPYFQRFSQISTKKREQILCSWSSSYFRLLRQLFYALKFLVLLIFFTQVKFHLSFPHLRDLESNEPNPTHNSTTIDLTLKNYYFQVDEKNENPSWKALGYCGPDPNFLIQQKGEDNTAKDEEDFFGPLYKGLVDPRQQRKVFAETLSRSGFPVSIHQSHRKTISHPSASLTIHCDAVVVGSGSGGGVIAGVLAKAGYKVVVLEKGNYYARNTLSLLEGPTMDQMYQGSGIVATDDLGVIILAGSTVGGGSTINWSASIKTPQHVIDDWSNNYELELFDSKLYKEAMEVVCGRMEVQSENYGEGFNNAVLRKGCLELGYPVNDIPRNSPPDHYCGWCCLGCKDGRKKGTSETWLVDMVNSGNGVILPGCEVIKVLHERKKGRTQDTATGILFEFDNYGKGKEVYHAKSKVTIIAGGAIGTPVLLRESGLRNPNIGKHLHLHPVAMAWGYFPDKFEQKKSYEGGIMTAMSTVVAEFDSSGYGAVIQAPALHPGMFSAVTPWVSGIDIKERMRRFSRTAHVFALARDRGSGEVSSTSKLSYKMDHSDEKNLQNGLEKVLRILAAAGAIEIGTHHHKGKRLNVNRASSHEFEKFVKEESGRDLRNLSGPICSAHQMGSCRMGIDPVRSVVNQRGETWEVEGLFLADSSVFPTALGVNPMVTIQAIAYCTSQSVLEVLRRKKNSY